MAVSSRRKIHRRPGPIHARFYLQADAETGPSGVVVAGTKLKIGTPIELEGQLYRVKGVVSGVTRHEPPWVALASWCRSAAQAGAAHSTEHLLQPLLPTIVRGYQDRPQRPLCPRCNAGFRGFGRLQHGSLSVSVLDDRGQLPGGHQWLAAEDSGLQPEVDQHSVRPIASVRRATENAVAPPQRWHLEIAGRGSRSQCS